MSNIEQLASGITDMQSAWDTFRQQAAQNGIRFEEAWAKWAEEQKERLALPGPQADFTELCQAGCVPEILASILAMIRFAPRIDEFWQETLGRTDQRRKAILSLEKAAEALKSYYAEFAVEANASTTKEVTKPKHGWPMNLLADIQSHNEMWTVFDLIAAKIDVNFIEFARYLFVAYVKGATGRFRDRNVSALLGEVLGPVDYDEVAQRMWRHRNYKCMAQNLSMFSELLINLSRVISSRT